MNIVSLDGGGIFGIHTAIVLQRLDATCPGFIDKIDVVAGTSVGGIIALGLAKGFTTQQIVDICNNSTAFFTSSLIRDAESDVGACAYYDNTGRQNVLTSGLGNTTLGQLEKYIVIQSFQMNAQPSWTSKIFHNIPSQINSQYVDSCNTLAVDAGMATTAAPIYFPAYQDFLDGGIVANNPSMTAIALTQDKTLNWKQGPISIQDINLFSIGRVYPGDLIDRHNFDAGWLKWAPIIIEMLLTGNQSTVDYQTKQFLGEKFFRHTGLIPTPLNFAIDDYKDVPKLAQWAENIDLTQEISWVKKNW